MKKFAYSLVVINLIFTPFAEGHGGGLDSTGGHYNRKTGEYHCHRCSAIIDVKKKKPSKPVAKTKKDKKEIRKKGDETTDTP
jgi:hypothetical protein